MQHDIEWFAAVLLTAVGLSQIYQANWWMERHRRLAEGGLGAMRVYGAIVLAAGGGLVTFHNVWTGPPLVLTAAGWLLVLEGAVGLFVPHLGLAGLARAEPEVRRTAVIVTGALGLIVAGVLWVHLLTVD